MTPAPALKPCAACAARGKTWSGSDPKCAFPNGSAFTTDNWNCATAGMIRDLCGQWEKNPDGVTHQYWEDQNYATVLTRDADIPGLVLWVSWYKSRGRTEAMWLMSELEPPRLPTEADILAIAEHYRRTPTKETR